MHLGRTSKPDPTTNHLVLKHSSVSCLLKVCILWHLLHMYMFTVPNAVAATRPVHESTFSKTQVLVYMLMERSYRSIPSGILMAHTE